MLNLRSITLLCVDVRKLGLKFFKGAHPILAFTLYNERVLIYFKKRGCNSIILTHKEEEILIV